MKMEKKYERDFMEIVIKNMKKNGKMIKLWMEKNLWKC